MINIGILGAGTVGSGVVKIFSEKKELFEKKLNTKLNIKKILVKNKEKERPSYFDNSILTTDPNEIINDPEIDIIVELIGGIEPAKTLILNAIKQGKHIITANKEVIAKYGDKIFSLALEKKVFVNIEGTVCGGIPIIQTIKRDLIANDITKLVGIVNGTTNYILTEMTYKKKSFDETLKLAQELGYAEADPTSDIEAYDSAYKLAILAFLIFGQKIPVEKIYREGITKIEAEDIAYADKLGYVIKLLAVISQNENKSYELRVHPSMISKEHPLASVNGVFNAVWLYGDSIGEFMLYGKGAGQLPTASAVVADILNLISETKAKRIVSTNSEYNKTPKLSHIDNSISQYYIRIETNDTFGVMGNIGNILGKCEVSIESIWQSKTDGKIAEIVIITHPAITKNINKAITLFEKSEFIKKVCNLVRVKY